MGQLHQSNVPDGMVANVPWGQSLDRWSDRMIERGLRHLSETDGAEFFPITFANMGAEAAQRGIEI